MTIDLNEVRRRRDERTQLVADWVMSNVPFTVTWWDYRPFRARWPLITKAELNAVYAELDRRAERIEHLLDGPELETIATMLVGRADYWQPAADWLLENFPPRGHTDPEFQRKFGEITRSELLLAIAKYDRLINGR